ncbi:MAG: 30S ribosomal protein S20 [Phycisphaerae bacterium]
MAHSLSAKKRVRQSEKRRARNRARKTLIRDEVKAFTAAITTGDVKKAEELLPKVAQRLDRTAAKNTIHKNAAARKRSRLAKKLNALKAGRIGPKAAAAAGKGKKAAKGTKAATA